MPAIRHFHISTPTSATTPTDDDDSPLICTCPTNSPPLDRTPILISKTSEKKRVRVRRAKNNNNHNQDRHHIPRPRNAFIIFRSHYINFLKSKQPSSDTTERTFPYEDSSTQDTKPTTTTTSSAEYQQNELSKIAAKVWNNMDPDERRPYSEEARKEKEWHKTMYPDYVYRVPNSSSANAGGEKMKGFKIKVKMGNPSKNRQKSKKSPSPIRPSPDNDIEVVGVQPRHWQETPSLQTHIGTEHEFVPTDCIPPLDLHASQQECQQETDVSQSELCPQPTFAVDLSPRSLAYDQYQAKDTLSSSSSAFVYPFPLGYEYGMVDPFEGFGFGPSFFNVPGIDFQLDVEGMPQAAVGDTFSYLPYPPPSSSSSSSFCANPVFLPQYPSFDYDLFSPSSSSSSSALDFQVGSGDKWDLDVPGFNFELGDEGCNSLAAWAGYE